MGQRIIEFQMVLKNFIENRSICKWKKLKQNNARRPVIYLQL